MVEAQPRVVRWEGTDASLPLRQPDPLDRVRWLFMAFSLVSAALLCTLLFALSLGRAWVAGVAVCPVLLGLKWFREFRVRDGGAVWDAAEAAALFGVGAACGSALTIIVVLYARVAVRALDGSARRVAALTGMYLAAFAGASAISWLSNRSPAQAAASLFLVSGLPLAASSMRLLGTTVTAERRANELSLRDRDADFRRVFDVNPQPMWLCDSATLRFLLVNEAALAAYGYSSEEFLQSRLTDVVDGDCDTDVSMAGQIPQQHRLKGGRRIDVKVVSCRVSFQGHDAVLQLARDVTDEHRLLHQLQQQALHDPLTGLPNRTLLEDHIRWALARADRQPGRSPAVLVFDLDGFKTVNDTLGHALGDRVIAAIGHRLAAAVRPGDTASRLSGDEFAVLLEEIDDSVHAVQIAHRLVDEIAQPLTIEGRSVAVGSSVGVALPHADHRGVEDLLSDADIAMYVAKSQADAGCVLYNASHRAALGARLSLQKDLTTALAGDQLSLHYQPQLDLRTGRVVAVEALVRWRHTTRGLVPPDEFIPLAEQMGLVSAIDEWVLRTACGQLRQWCDEGLSLRIAVNLSGRDLERLDLVEMVRSTLLEAMLDPWQLELELTESVAVAQTETTIARLRELRAMGVRLAIDDFGTGYSMLSRLRALPVDRLKIDRSFVTDLDRDDDARTIVRSTIAMGHSLGLDLVAEGVENAACAVLLQEMECDTAQGYHYARPLPAVEMTRWLWQRQRPQTHEQSAAV